MNLDDASTRQAVERVLQRTAQAERLSLTQWSRLSGGAIQENLRIVCEVTGGPHAGKQQWVLRTDAASVVASSRSRAEEFAILRLAHTSGVAVPEPFFLHEAAAALPAFFVMAFCEGVAAAHVLTKPGAIADPAGFLRDAGAQLARIHDMRVAPGALPFLGERSRHPTRDVLRTARGYLDHWRQRFGDSHPVLEWGIQRWLRRAPAEEEVVFAHRDYRTGNLLMADSRVRAIFDWEFAGWGNPLEDLGWICAPCWRFNGRQRVAGGIGEADDLLAGYNAVRGSHWRAADLLAWEALAQIRWSIIALQQAERHLCGGEPSLELALTGRLVAELELDLLVLLERWESVT